MKYCRDCLYFGGRSHALSSECTNIKVMELADRVDGKQVLGTKGDAYILRMVNSACGADGAWWEQADETLTDDSLRAAHEFPDRRIPTK